MITVLAIWVLTAAWILTLWPILRGSVRVRLLTYFCSAGIVMALCTLSYRVGYVLGGDDVLSDLIRPMGVLLQDLNDTAAQEGKDALLKYKLKATQDAWLLYGSGKTNMADAIRPILRTHD